MADDQSAVDSRGPMPLGPPPLEGYPPSFLVPTFVREMDCHFSRSARNGDGLSESSPSILRFRKAIGLLLRNYGHAVEPFLVFMARVQSSNPSIKTDLEREWINLKATLQGIEIEYDARNWNDKEADLASKKSLGMAGRPDSNLELDRRVAAYRKANPKVTSHAKIASSLSTSEIPISKRDVDLSIDRWRQRKNNLI